MSFYFFTDISSLDIQTSNGFGPAANTTIDNANYEQFLVTSKHTAASDVNAIAVCKGQILVQEQSANASLLNIVFKPMETQPFNFPKIKYFIYKGIKKDSLIAANNTDIVAKGTNDLADSIWTAFEKINQSGSPTKSILGLDTSINALTDDVVLEDVFSSVYPGVQFWNVPAGGTLGKFDKDAIGFEIVLDTMFYKPALELARNSETYVKANVLTANPQQKDFFEHWHDKETILNFIDPCAFFGSFYSDKLSVTSNGQVDKLAKEDLYNNLLTKFMNKNLCYIDIRNEFNFSLNYFKNYGISVTDNITHIKVKKGISAALATIDYYKSGWPIMTLENTDFSNTTLAYQTVTLQLPAGNGDNPAPLVYFSKAYIPSDNFPSEFNKKEKFKKLSVEDNSCSEFSIALPWIDNNLISCYNQIKYCKQYTEDTLPDTLATQIRRTDYLDAIFPTVLNFDPTNSIFKSKTYYEDLYVDVRTVHNYDAAFSLTISFDSENVMLIANPTTTNDEDSQRVPLDLTHQFKPKTNNDNTIEDWSINENGSDLVRKILTSDNGDFEVLNVISSFTDIEARLNIPDLRRLLGVTLTGDQWSTIIQTASNSEFSLKYPVYITVIDKAVLEDVNEVNYTSFNLGLKGFKIEGDQIKVQIVPTNLNLTTYGTF